MLRPSPNHGTQRLPNDDDDDDFNYPNIKWDSESTESNTVEDKFIENIRDNFLFQHITMPTRGRLGNKSNIFELIFTNEESMIEDVTYESPLGKVITLYY